jgi:hypothetical protein
MGLYESMTPRNGLFLELFQNQEKGFVQADAGWRVAKGEENRQL